MRARSIGRVAVSSFVLALSSSIGCASDGTSKSSAPDGGRPSAGGGGGAATGAGGLGTESGGTAGTGGGTAEAGGASSAGGTAESGGGGGFDGGSSGASGAGGAGNAGASAGGASGAGGAGNAGASAGGASGAGGAGNAGASAGGADASTGAGGACSGCASGLCLADGGCVECLATPTDTCAPGTYCSPDHACVSGCKTGSTTECASGSCGATHDCDHCVSDAECSGGRLCSGGQCVASCTGASTPDASIPDASTPDAASCGVGLTCCDDRCVDLSRDPHHCGSCGQSCDAPDFCGANGCRASVIANLCATSRATFLLDGQTIDDAGAASIQTALLAACPGQASRLVDPATSGSMNPTTGKPVASGNDLLVVVGGPFGQLLIRYLDQNRISPLYDVYNDTVNQLYGRSSDGGPDPLIVNEPQQNITPTHSYFLVEMVVDPPSGSAVLGIYGLSGPGTEAADFYFRTQMLPDISTFSRRFYVYEWTDTDATAGPSDGDSFALKMSGD